MNRVEIKIAVMEAEIALHRLKPVIEYIQSKTNYDEIKTAWQDYCAAFARIQYALRDIGAL